MNAIFQPDRNQIERATRTVTLLIVAKVRSGGREGLCRVRNVSPGGLMLETRLPLECGDPVEIEVRNQRLLLGLVAWVRQGRAGVAFSNEVPIDDLLCVAPARPSRVLKTRVPRPPRLQVDCPVEIQLPTGKIEASLKDISQGGAKLVMALQPPRGERLLLLVPGLPLKLGIVRWVKGEVGLAFAEPLSFDILTEWLLAQQG